MPLQICNSTDEEWYNFYCFFILFSLSPLFSLTYVFSPLFSTKNGINLHQFASLSRHRRSIIADLSPVAFCIVIADLSGNRHHHRRSKSTLRWDRSVHHDRGHRRWDLDRGHQRWGEVRSWSWVASASGFWLPVQVDSWLWVGGASSFVGFGCVFWIWVVVLVGVALFLMGFVVDLSCCASGFELLC